MVSLFPPGRAFISNHVARRAWAVNNAGMGFHNPAHCTPGACVRCMLYVPARLCVCMRTCTRTYHHRRMSFFRCRLSSITQCFLTLFRHSWSFRAFVDKSRYASISQRALQFARAKSISNVHRHLNSLWIHRVLQNSWVERERDFACKCSRHIAKATRRTDRVIVAAGRDGLSDRWILTNVIER